MRFSVLLSQNCAKGIFFIWIQCFRFILRSGRMLPLRPPAGKPGSLVCTYAATGHNSAVLSLDVTEDLMFTGSKGWFHIFNFLSILRNELVLFPGYTRDTVPRID